MSPPPPTERDSVRTPLMDDAGQEQGPSHGRGPGQGQGQGHGQGQGPATPLQEASIPARENGHKHEHGDAQGHEQRHEHGHGHGKVPPPLASPRPSLPSPRPSLAGSVASRASSHASHVMGGDVEQKVGTLELFLDLAVVVITNFIAEPLGEELNGRVITIYGVRCLFLWYLWHGGVIVRTKPRTTHHAPRAAHHA